MVTVHDWSGGTVSFCCMIMLISECPGQLHVLASCHHKYFVGHPAAKTMFFAEHPIANDYALGVKISFILCPVLFITRLQCVTTCIHVYSETE